MRKGPVYLSVTSSANLKALDDTAAKLRQVGKSAKTTSSGLSGFGKSLAKVASVSAVIGVGVKAIKEATEAFKTTAMTEQLLKNTGLAASVTSKQIGDLSMQISNLTGIDDEQVQAASNVLLGFKGLVPAGAQAQSTLANLTQVATDLGVKMGKDPAAAAKILGKALMDPAKGVAALYRAGIPLDAQLSERIKNMTKAGQVEQARALILQNVASSTQGLAAAVADPMTRLQTMFNNLLEIVGTPILDALTPIISALTPVMQDLTPVLQEVGILAAAVVTALGDGLQPILPVLIKAVQTLTPSFMGLVMEVGALLPLFVALTPMLGVLVQLLAKALPMAIQTSSRLIRGLIIAFQQYFNLISNVLVGPLAQFKQAFVDASTAAQSVVDQLDVISKTDYSKMSTGLAVQTVDYATAAKALKQGAADANAAAKAVGSSMGKKTPKVKPKTATKPSTAKTTGDQSFMVAGSGGGLSLSVTVNGSVVQERDIARTIRDELMQFARRQGVTPQFGV